MGSGPELNTSIGQPRIASLIVIDLVSAVPQSTNLRLGKTAIRGWSWKEDTDDPEFRGRSVGRRPHRLALA